MAMTQRRLLALFAVATLALVAIVGLALASRDPAQPERAQFEGALMPPNVPAPGFTGMRDETGRQISWASFKGKPAIVTFLYTHCKDTCPVEAKIVTQAQHDLGGNVPTIAISVDPRHDTPASARAFNKKQGVKVTWVLGSEGKVQKLWRGYAIQPQSNDQEHQARVVLIDKRGMQRVGYPYTQLTPERIAHDIRLLQRL